MKLIHKQTAELNVSPMTIFKHLSAMGKAKNFTRYKLINQEYDYARLRKITQFFL